jgi:hypothetical protein
MPMKQKACHLPYRLLMPLLVNNIPWDFIFLDFIVKLPTSGFDSILVTVDQFTKMAHFISCFETIITKGIARMVYLQGLGFYP